MDFRVSISDIYTKIVGYGGKGSGGLLGKVGRAVHAPRVVFWTNSTPEPISSARLLGLD